MLVLAVFLGIGITAILFLTRFLLALESEAKSARSRSAFRMEPVSNGRTRGLAPVIELVHSSSRQALSQPQATSILNFQRKSQFHAREA
jgi:hypothetical protein